MGPTFHFEFIQSSRPQSPYHISYISPQSQINPIYIHQYVRKPRDVQLLMSLDNNGIDTKRGERVKENDDPCWLDLVCKMISGIQSTLIGKTKGKEVINKNPQSHGIAGAMVQK